MALPLSPPVFAILRGLVEDKTGIHFDDGDMDLFLAKVSPRAEEAGFQSLLDYYYFLRYDDGAVAEMDALVEHLVVRETYLFREFDQLRCLVDRWLLPRLAAGETMRIWSAACSTGDEPLSLAILLAEAGVIDQVEIVASDLSRRALEVAQKGRFTRRSLRAVPPALAGKFATRQPDGSVEVDPGLVARVRWLRMNLLEAGAAAHLGTFDVILCRNVLIYFDDKTIQDVVESLADRLRPGGALLVSVTESLARHGTSLICEEHDSVFFYRKACE
jgi:chemotaxis protein methyltransferase CheR